MISCALFLFLATAAGGELPGLDAPVRGSSPAPADAAVIVGVEDYAFIDDVPYASADAQAVYDLLLYTRGIPPQNLHLLQGASREQVVNHLEQAVGQVGPGGRLWFYFAGHGAASTQDGQRMLLGDDVRPDPSVFDSRGLRLDEITSALRDVESLLILDTCYAGASRGGGPILDGTRFVVPASALEPTGRVAVWSAAAPSELSSALDEVGHGAFTYFAVGALRGWADGELSGQRDGRVDLDEAQAFVRRAMATRQLTTHHAQVEGELEALTWADEEGPGWTSLSPSPAVGPPTALPSAPRRARSPRARTAGLILVGSGAALGVGSVVAARSVEAPSRSLVTGLTAVNTIGWSAVGLGGGLVVLGSLRVEDAPVSEGPRVRDAAVAVGGRF